VVVGIGSTLFSQFTTGFGAAQPTVEDALTIVLASLSLLGLGIFGPAVANGIVSGGPQLGAGSAIGANLAAGGMVAAGAGMASVGGSSLSSAASTLASKGAYAAGATSGAYQAGGVAGVAGAAANAMSSPLRSAASTIQSSFASGVGGSSGSPINGGASSSDGPPDWARRMRRNQLITNGASQTIHAVKSGHEGGGSSSVDLSEG
jgi:type IV secretion system protein TrbL